MSISLEDALAVVLERGLPLVQIRHKRAFDRDFCALLERCAHRASSFPTQVILNDRADYARMFGFGLHVGQDDLPAAAAREIIGPDAWLGLSTHNREQLLDGALAPVNYLALGPIFSTVSKDNPDPVVGLDALREWRSLSPVPLVAIGGIGFDTARLVLDAGVDFVSLISGLWTSPYTLETFGENIDQWRKMLEQHR